VEQSAARQVDLRGDATVARRLAGLPAEAGVWVGLDRVRPNAEAFPGARFHADGGEAQSAHRAGHPGEEIRVELSGAAVRVRRYRPARAAGDQKESVRGAGRPRVLGGREEERACLELPQAVAEPKRAARVEACPGQPKEAAPMHREQAAAF
jgi:hypothetical protein